MYGHYRLFHVRPWGGGGGRGTWRSIEGTKKRKGNLGGGGGGGERIKVRVEEKQGEIWERKNERTKRRRERSKMDKKKGGKKEKEGEKKKENKETRPGFESRIFHLVNICLNYWAHVFVGLFFN